MMEDKKKSTGIKTWPEDDRPREKLLKKGARAELGVELGPTSQAICSRIARVRYEFSTRKIKSLLE